ncbi:putative LmbE-like protein [Metallosphaera yellowstonensis MK1]|uniref:Putative LmbE-like protein n=2 Tax=Metallosphaera TaxID=41980 RepID=H2C1X3_9CREN|nr:putative LmbE-like protein [Metallosphaera yellowstonensis MK1]
MYREYIGRSERMTSKLLVISAHVGDFVWRASGTVAKTVKRGGEAHVVALSFGERGESGGAWRRGAKSVEEVKKIRREEAECASNALGNISIDFMDWGDHPLVFNEARVIEIARIIRKYSPEVLITHGPDTQTRPDHVNTANAVLTAVRLAAIDGLQLEYPPVPEPKIFGFDPHVADQVGFYPHVYINITDVYDMKQKAMNCLESQKNEVEYYSLRDQLRGLQTRRFGWKNYYKYAEAFYMYTPIIGDDLP